MSKSARKYTVGLNANTVELSIAGGYFKVLAAPAAINVELLDRGSVVLKADSISAGFYQRATFDTVRLGYSGAQDVDILVAPLEGGSDQFTGSFSISSPLLGDNADAVAASGASSLLGTIARLMGFNGATYDRLRADNEGAGVGALRVSRFGDAITAAGAAFSMWQSVGAVAAQLTHSQVKNPAASGKVVYVDEMVVCAGAAAESFIYGQKDADLTTDGGAFPNLNNSGAAGVAHIRRQTNAASLLDNEVGQLNVPANDSRTVRFDPPIRLAAGEGFAVRNATVNVTHNCTFKIREKDA